MTRGRCGWTALYCLAANLPAGEHAVQLVKRTEAHTGVFQVLGVQLEQAAELLPPNKVDRRVEVIGDSISCGYGNEAANQNQHYTPDTQNGYLDKVAGELTQGGDKRIHRVDFDPQDGNRDGLGGDWHPNLKTHNLMAGKLVEAIAKELGWKPLVAVEPVAVPQPAAAAAPAASEKPAAAEKMIVWDGEAKKGGSGWTAPEKSGTIAPQERDAHSATAALEWHGTAAAETYAGCGWNWFGWWPADSGTDISAYGQLSFWVKVTGSPANPAIQVSLNCSSTKKPTAAVPLADYAKDFADGQWHQVTIPLQDIYKKEKTDFDPKTAWELDLGTWNMDAADLHVFIDDIGFGRQK